jgi:hypothetical protein
MRVLRGLTSRFLPCGCVAGVYETYDGLVVTLLDERVPACSDVRHVEGNEIPESEDLARPVADQARRRQK